jgi:hypothetical protein
MILYDKYVPIMVHRLNIFEEGHQTSHVAFTNTNMEEVQKFVLSLLPKKQEGGKKIIVQIRENKGGANGKARNITIHGYSASFFKSAVIARINMKPIAKKYAQSTNV